MKVKNKYTSHLGLGTIRVLPGETVELPKMYNENHPIIKWYISRGWLEIVDKGISSDTNTNGSTVTITATINNGNADTVDEEKEGAVNTENVDNENGAKDAEKTDLATKNVDRLTLDELKTLATELKLEVAEDDTRKVLIEKIKATKIEE